MPPPPIVTTFAKWLGVGIATPSICHSIPLGAFPLTTIALSPRLPETPANDEARRAGSPNPPAYRDASAVLSCRALVVPTGLMGGLFKGGGGTAGAPIAIPD